MAREDYTTYTEQDINGHLGVALNDLTCTNVSRTEDLWLYDNKGVGHFGATFEHLVEVLCTAASGGFALVCFWEVANDIEAVRKVIVDTIG